MDGMVRCPHTFDTNVIHDFIHLLHICYLQKKKAKHKWIALYLQFLLLLIMLQTMTSRYIGTQLIFCQCICECVNSEITKKQNKVFTSRGGVSILTRHREQTTGL